jgi:hypothetical protein
MTHWTGKIARVAAISLLVGCQVSPLASGGALSFRFQYNNLQSSNFQIKAIPAGTEDIEIEISGEGLSVPRKESFKLAAGNTTHAKTIKDLPTGPKQVTVRALNGDDVMASGSANVEIEVGETAKAELELKALQAASTVELEQLLPLTISLKASISGEGLEQAVERTATIEATQLSGSFGNLPLGQKRASIVLSAPLGNQMVSAPALTFNFNVTADGGSLKLGAQSVLAAFEANLEDMLKAANPLILLAWINAIRSNPDKLRELFFLLPKSAQDRLRQNPLVSEYLPAPEEMPVPSSEPTTSPSSEPTASPVTEPSPSPEVTASPVVEAESLFADVRLALQKPEFPALVMLTPPEDIAGRIRVLQPGQQITIASNTMWGLLIRSSYTGAQEIPFSASLKEVESTDLNTTNRVWNTGLRQRFTVNDKGFMGEIIPFKSDGTLINVPSGTYNLIVSLKHPETGVLESQSYTIQAN